MSSEYDALDSKSSDKEVAFDPSIPEDTRVPENAVRSTHYTWYNCVPLNLWEQFHRPANVWFLMVSILQMLPLNLSPTLWYATALPLAVVLFVSMIQAFLEDLRRYYSDIQVNSQPCRVVVCVNGQGQYKEKYWQHVRLGEIVVLQSGEEVPADCILLSSESAVGDGTCLVETSQLDGETSRKLREPTSDTARATKLQDVAQLKGSVTLGPPSAQLDVFTASLRLNGYPRSCPADPTNLLLRGAKIAETPAVYGVVVGVGNETKIMRNASETARAKVPQIEDLTTRFLGIILGILFGSAFVSLIAQTYYMNNYPAMDEYFGGKTEHGPILRALTFVILYNVLIPLSLYVSLDLIRTALARSIEADPRINWDGLPGGCPAQALTANLVSDLGQVDYLFSDKTGTLTENRMELVRMSCKGSLFGGPDAVEPPQVPSGNKMQNGFLYHSKGRLYDPHFLKRVRDNDDDFMDIMRCLIYCHGMSVTFDETIGEPVFEGASPDEEATLVAVYCNGFELLPKGVNREITEWKNHHTGLKNSGHIRCVNDFTSDRKRMSVIVQHSPSGNTGSTRYTLYCKGADSVLLDLCTAGEDNDAAKGTAIEHTKQFAEQGLRTLVLAKKELGPDEAEMLLQEFESARTSVVDRDVQMEKAAAKMEIDMQLLGVTAIEDKIQDGVPETLRGLMDGGVKVWMLTGDKTETAVNIGYSTNLLRNNVHLLYITGEAQPELNDGVLDDGVPTITVMSEQKKLGLDEAVKQFSVDLKVPYCVVVDGSAVGKVWDRDMKPQFLNLVHAADCVIGCRLAPRQKASLVALVKDNVYPPPTTMSVGDGANDVAMLQEAHVGVGIHGLEGSKAVRSSDFALGRFKYLLPLLFLHGRRMYNNVSLVIVYTFFKQICLLFTQFLFTFDNCYSGNTLYDSWLLTWYNVLFTFVPVFFVGHDENDLPDEISLKYPVLYQQGQLKASFNKYVFTQWMVRGLIYATITYTLCTWMLRDRVDYHGVPLTLEMVGTTTYWVVITQANVELLIRINNRRPRVVFISVMSILAYYPVMQWYSNTFWKGSGNSFSMQGVGASVLASTVTYQTLGAGVGFYMFVSLFMKRLQIMIKPSPIDKIMQAIRTNEDFAIHSNKTTIPREVRYKDYTKQSAPTEKQAEVDQLRSYTLLDADDRLHDA